MSKKVTYFISVADVKGKRGAVLVEFEATPDFQAYRLDEAEDGLELNRFYTTAELKKLGY